MRFGATRAIRPCSRNINMYRNKCMERCDLGFINRLFLQFRIYSEQHGKIPSQGWTVLWTVECNEKMVKLIVPCTLLCAILSTPVYHLEII